MGVQPISVGNLAFSVQTYPRCKSCSPWFSEDLLELCADLASLWLQLQWARQPVARQERWGAWHSPPTPAIPLIQLMLLLPWLLLFLVLPISIQCTATGQTSLPQTQPQSGFLPPSCRWDAGRDWKQWRRFWKEIKISGKRGSWGFAAQCPPMGNQGLWVLWLAEGLLETQERNFPYLWLSSVGAGKQ